MSAPDADFQQFFCQSCGAKLKAKASKAGKELPCPKCATVLVVPGSTTGLRESETIATAPTGSNTYEIREAEQDPMPVSKPSGQSDSNTTESYAISDMSTDRNPDDQYSDEETAYGGRKRRGLIQEPSVRPTLPQWPLVQGVLGFMLDPGAIVYWSILSFMATFCVSLLAVAVGLAGGNSAMMLFGSAFAHGIIGVAGFVFILIDGVCCLAILQESAAGNRTIEDWPGFAIIEHIVEAFFFINSVLVAAAAAWFLTAPFASLGIVRAFSEIGCFVIFFPIVLLSMLEAGSCLLPVSAAVYSSLRRSWGSWLVFFIASLILAFGLLIYVELLAFLLRNYSEHVTIPIVFMTVAIGVAPAMLLEMIYFRLLGRLAWICDEDSRKELAEAEDAEEDGQENDAATEIRPVPADDF